MGRGDGTRDVASLHVASMAARKLGRAALRRGLDDIASRDADIGAALARLGYPAPRQSDGGFAALLRIMVSQQLSTRSAAAIWGRLAAAAGPEVTPHSVLALDDAALRGAGLSGRKMEYGRGLAEAVDCGALDLDGLAKLSDEEGIAAISALRGFGRWSAEIYLLFALDRADIWPADDFAVRAALRRLKRLDAMPSRREMDAIAEPWRPWRGYAAIFLWHYYGAATLDN